MRVHSCSDKKDVCFQLSSCTSLPRLDLSSPPPALQGRALPGTIDDLCSMMTNKTLGTELNRYAVVNSWLLESANQSSLDVSYSGLVAALRNTSWDAPASEGGGRGVRVCACVCACVFNLFTFYQTIWL